MSFSLYLWRRRASARRSRGFTYLVLAEGLPCDGVEPIVPASIESDLDEVAPQWRTSDAGFTVDISPVSVHVGLRSGGAGERGFDVVRGLAARHSLEIFDPQDEASVTAKDERDAAAYIAGQRDAAREEEVGVWMRAAADGDANAMNELATAYSFGEGVRENAALAAQWYARAAAGGHRLAMANLAECYRSGEGVGPDAQTSIHWFERSGALGNMEALVRLAELLRSGDGIPKDNAAARRVLERASETDRMASTFYLAEMCEAGEGGARDLDRAKALYGVALEHRHPEARVRLRRLGVEA